MQLSKTYAFRCCLLSIAGVFAFSHASADEADPAVLIREFSSSRGSCFAIAARSPLPSGPAVTRHVILVDTSASQVGTVRESSLEVTSQILANLSPRSGVQIFAVDVTTDSLTPGMVQTASRDINTALQKLALRTPLGTTDLKAALKQLVSLADQKKPTSVLYIGDGLATSSLIQQPELKSIIDGLNAGHMSVHSLVIGPKTDTELPGILANLTGGTMRTLDAGRERIAATEVSAALQTAPVAVKTLAADGTPLTVAGGRKIYLRPDRHSIILAQGKLGPFKKLTAASDSGAITFADTQCRRTAGDVSLAHIVDRCVQSSGINAPFANLDSFKAAAREFTQAVASYDKAERLLLRHGKYKEARRVKGILTAMQQPPTNGVEQLPPPPADAAPQDNPPAPADDAPAPAPLPGDEAAPAPAAAGGVEPVPAVGADDLVPPDPQNDSEPAVQTFTEPLQDDPAANPDPLADVEAEVKLQTQILAAETNAAIDEANEVSFDQPEYATNLLKDILETIQSSADISPDVRSELERRVVAAITTVRNQQEVNTLRRKQIARDKAVEEAQRKVIAEQEIDERRIGILIDQVRGLLDRARKGDRNGFEDAETVSRTALDLKPGNGPATQALVMSEALGQLDKAYRLVNLRHDRFLEVLYQVELSHVPFPDEPPIQYPPADVWRALTLVRKPKYESFDLRSEKPVEKWLRQMLDKPVPLLDFPGDTPLSEVMDFLSTHFNQTYGELEGKPLRMTVWPDAAELELEGITTLEDVTVRDISFEGITLRNALKLIFEQTTEPELTYVIQNEVFMVTTLAKAESDDNLVTRVYPVADLVIPPVQLGGGGGFGGGGLGGGQQGGVFGAGGGQGGGGFGGGGQGGGGFGGGAGFSVPPEVFKLLEEDKEGITNEALNIKKKPVLN